MANNIERVAQTLVVPSGGTNVPSVYGLNREEMRAMMDMAQIQGLASGVAPLTEEGFRALQIQLSQAPLRDGDYVDATALVVMDHPDRNNYDRATLRVSMRVSRNRC